MCFPAVRLVLRIGIAQHPMHSRVFVGGLADVTGRVIDIGAVRAYASFIVESSASDLVVTSTPTAHFITLFSHVPRGGAAPVLRPARWR